VLAAASSLFAKQGITATTMEDAAAEAPVSKRTRYAHFPTKEDLVLAQLDHLDAPELLAEQLVTLADGVASRGMVLSDPDYGRHARAAAETTTPVPQESLTSQRVRQLHDDGGKHAPGLLIFHGGEQRWRSLCPSPPPGCSPA
jgi:AcrR family transcriptional regulator